MGAGNRRLMESERGAFLSRLYSDNLIIREPTDPSFQVYGNLHVVQRSLMIDRSRRSCEHKTRFPPTYPMSVSMDLGT